MSDTLGYANIDTRRRETGSTKSKHTASYQVTPTKPEFWLALHQETHRSQLPLRVWGPVCVFRQCAYQSYEGAIKCWKHREVSATT